MDRTEQVELENDHNVILDEDNTGLDEIQKALDEINKRTNNDDQEERHETEEEEVVEEVPEDSDSEESLEEEAPKPEKQDRKTWKIKKRMYQAVAEKEALAQENLKLQQMLGEALNSSVYHYARTAYLDLEKAKQDKKRALEEGDVDALLEADIAVTRSLNKIAESEKFEHQENQRIQPPVNYPPQYNKPLGVRGQEMANDWLEEHPYLQRSSPHYEPKTTKKVVDFIQKLDENLANNNRQEDIYSEQYFDYIDDYIDGIKKASLQNQKNLMSVGRVGGVRNSQVSSVNGRSSGPIKMTLSKDEIAWCANLGVAQSDWLKRKLLEDLKNKKER